jgi:FtsH-binding integral membrane protein
MSRFGNFNPSVMAQANANVSPDMAAEQRSFLHRTYGWMAIALAVTGLVGWGVSQSPSLVQSLANAWIFLLIVQVVLALGLSFAINRISSAVATLLFLAYAASFGLTVSIILLVFTAASVFTAFFITAGTFAALAIWGTFTNADLTKLGSIAGMALIGLIIAMLVSFFVHSTMMEMLINIAGVLIFTALTAYDAQKIKYMYLVGSETSEVSKKASVMGAFTLYLDFINLFMFILQFVAQQRE